MQDLRAEGHEEEARGLRVRLGRSSRPSRTNRRHRSGAQRPGLLGQRSCQYQVISSISFRACRLKRATFINDVTQLVREGIHTFVTLKNSQFNMTGGKWVRSLPNLF